MKHLLLAATAAASLILPLAASEPAQIASPGEIAEAAPASDWIAIAQSDLRSEEHTSELQSLMRITYAGFCLKKKKTGYYTTKLYQKYTITDIMKQIRLNSIQQ